MKTVIVLGAGNVGFYVASLLNVLKYEVTVADISEERLAKCRGVGADTMNIDISDPETGIFPICAMYDAVVNCVPGRIARATQEGLVHAGAQFIVDTTFGPDDPFRLHGKCLTHNRAVRGCLFIPDMGVAPGLSNMLIAEARDMLGEDIDSAEIYVGGLPVSRFKPWEYQVSFNLPDTMAEYTREARVIRKRDVTHVEPMSEIKLVEAPGIGTLEGFVSDGLRTLAVTQVGKLNSLAEYTLRYPGHCQLVKECMDDGYWTEKTLAREWRVQSMATFLYMEVRAVSATKQVRLTVRVDNNGVGDSMAVATATPAASAVHVFMEDEGRVEGSLRGLLPPEQFDREQREKIFSLVEKQGVRLSRQMTVRSDS